MISDQQTFKMSLISSEALENTGFWRMTNCPYIFVFLAVYYISERTIKMSLRAKK
jgi:hypothetical protein